MGDSIIGTKDIKDYKTLARQLLAEFVGTFLYLFVAATVGYDRGASGYTTFVVETALANGLVIASVIYTIGHISGGHINPAVTVGVLICGVTKMSIWRAILYVIVQILGSIFGAFVAYGLSTDELRKELGATVPSQHLKSGQVFCIELILTFMLVALVLSVCDARRDKSGFGLDALMIGLCVTGCQSGALMLTASLNPVRSLGPAVIMNTWKCQEMYWLGPIAGGSAAGFVYRFIFKRNIIENEIETE